MYFCERSGASLWPAPTPAPGALTARASFGDWIALLHVCDETARSSSMRRPTPRPPGAGHPEAASARWLQHCVQLTWTMCPRPSAAKQVFGIVFEQGRNELEVIDESMLENLVTDNKTLTAEKRDLTSASYYPETAPSPTACAPRQGGRGQFGVGAGQQSSFTAPSGGQQGLTWQLRHHPKVLALALPGGHRRPNRTMPLTFTSATQYEDVYSECDAGPDFTEQPAPLTARKRRHGWLR